ncbi:vacuolar sorting-associated 62 [Cordyceps militaris]|uniref:Vacuolar sorting-associated 62 n=1 Tax=Cordyceps militaris TaxID=73501 RepID=A0A2H4S872_CORMI|nr:vacuolar sorting-associated 62 [Cordyceps militaris]
MVNEEPVANPVSVSLDNLEQLNVFGKKKVALTSKDDVNKMPEWLYGETPDANGKLQNATASVVIVVERNSEDVDAFYFYFYSFDQGANMTQVKEPLGSFIGTQGGVHFGSHIGDCEQEHDSILFDYCDKGILWDPVASAYFFHLDPDSSRLTRLSPSASDPATSNLTSFFYFDGIWGDDEYSQDDPRQRKVPWVGLKRFVAGPQGPAFKGLVRKGLFPNDRGGKNVLQLAAAAFMAVYPHLFKSWRKWVTILVFCMLVALLVVGGRRVAKRRKQTKLGYAHLEAENIPLMEMPLRRDGSRSPPEIGSDDTH